jgi:hypothetical protein
VEGKRGQVHMFLFGGRGKDGKTARCIGLWIQLADLM